MKISIQYQDGQQEHIGVPDSWVASTFLKRPLWEISRMIIESDRVEDGTCLLVKAKPEPNLTELGRYRLALTMIRAGADNAQQIAREALG